jgi:L-iditol 2-dehydrogenase
MQALIMDENRHMILRDMPRPQPKEDNLIVKVCSASICGTDMRTFLKGNDKINVPRILGHECAGEIVHVGKLAEDNGYHLGDRVTVAPAIGCGHCRPCEKGHTNMCNHLETIGFQYDGVFAPYVEIPSQAIKMHNVIHLHDNISFDDATLAEPAACALNGQSYMHIEKGDNVVVYGSGIIGCIHAELAFLQGASKVIICEPVEKRGKIAQQKVPGVIWINNGPNGVNAIDKVMELTNGNGADVVIIAASVPFLHTEAQQIAAKMGRISLFGGIAGESKGFIDSNLIHYKELQVCGVHATTPHYMKQILKFIEEGKLNPAKYVERKLPLSQIMDGFKSIRDDNVMKVVVHPQEG